MANQVLGREKLDLVLVPLGLAVMVVYHLCLLARIIRRPETTVIGYENHNKRAWVARMLQASSSEVALAMDVMSSNVMASNTLASISIAMSSLISAWVSSANGLFSSAVIYGDTSKSTITIKYVSLLVCFLVAFSCFVQASRHYVHASFQLTTLDSDVPVGYVQTAVLRGGYFWSAGLRALYFATTFLLWFFGPIPMLVSSVLMVLMLHLLDTNTVQLHHFRFRDFRKRVLPQDDG